MNSPRCCECGKRIVGVPRYLSNIRCAACSSGAEAGSLFATEVCRLAATGVWNVPSGKEKRRRGEAAEGGVGTQSRRRG